MTKVPRAPGSPVQLKNSLETLIPNTPPPGESRAAQLVVCEYVKQFHDGEPLEDQAVVARELLDILGLLERR